MNSMDEPQHACCVYVLSHSVVISVWPPAALPFVFTFCIVWLVFAKKGALTCRLIVCRPTERERTECLIKAKLRNIMTFQDLENITSKEVREQKYFGAF